ncbi:hypothetical protein SARC_08469, partial [Sphaeroforma arctica JP610]
QVHHIYKNIRNTELINQTWSKKKDQAPVIGQITALFNQWSAWAIRLILSGGSPEIRGRAIEKIVEVGD